MASKIVNAALEVFRELRTMCYYFNWIRGTTKEVLFFVSEKILSINRRRKFWLGFLQDSITIMVWMINVLWYFTPYLSIINGYLMSSLEEMLLELQLNVTLEVQILKSNHYCYFSLLYLSLNIGCIRLKAKRINIENYVLNCFYVIIFPSILAFVIWSLFTCLYLSSIYF